MLPTVDSFSLLSWQASAPTGIARFERVWHMRTLCNTPFRLAIQRASYRRLLRLTLQKLLNYCMGTGKPTASLTCCNHVRLEAHGMYLFAPS